MEGFGPQVVFDFTIPYLNLYVPITQTVIVTWFLMLVLGITSFLVTRNFEKIPKKVQNIVELLVDTINNFTKSTMGEDKAKFAPFTGTLLIFLALSNILGVIGIRPPTADLNTTFAFSFITFMLIQIYSLKANGLVNRLKGFTQPIVLFTPLNILGEIATPVSLAFRMFGNIVGGMIIMDLFYKMLAHFSAAIIGTTAFPFLQLVIPIPFHLYFDIFAGVLQSFIFTMLTLINVKMAME